MGRSSSSCLKIITCGSKSTDGEDRYDRFDAPENKGSGDKRGWSFRKRSARHRVLSNTVISENPPSANKEIPDSVNPNLRPPDNTVISEKISSTAPEKVSGTQSSEEKLVLPTVGDSEVPKATVDSSSEVPKATVDSCSEVPKATVDSKNENEVGIQLEESVVVIQTAVREVLAEKELLKHKNVIKLQAAVRGHLVRRRAVGALRCVQALVKIQLLVRARHARTFDEKHEKEKVVSVNKPTSNYISIQKLLGNSFARQLLESTPKTKPILIVRDDPRPNSAWSWLERWMYVSSVEPTPRPQEELLTEHQESKTFENISSKMESRTTSDGSSESEELQSNVKEAELSSKHEENLIVDSQPSSMEESVEKLPQYDHAITSAPKETSDFDSKACKEEAEGEQPDQSKRSMKRSASEELETEGKKFVSGSRKASNPSFIAAQSRFEDLSSTINSNRTFCSISRDSGIASNVDTAQSAVDNLASKKDLNMADNSVSSNSRVHYVGSECGTELSVTSTLDSPDISEIGVQEYESNKKVSEEETFDTSSTNVVDNKAMVTSTNMESDLVQHVEDGPEKVDVDGEHVDTITISDNQEMEMKPERTIADVPVGAESTRDVPAYRSSPEASPRSHMTVPESQGTPASNVSVNAKRTSSKRKSLSTSKKSSAVNTNSGISSVEQLPKDQKDGKRHNSVGSTRADRTDQTEQEPRASNSSSSNSLPHFMQATESARAKINANSSPRSSPDIHDRDYVKKRHSLPGASGRQASPRIHRSLSQAQQGAKVNGSHIVHEKKWQR